MPGTLGIKALRKMQLGKETTAGTAVAATTIWRGPVETIQDDRETVWVEEDVGYVSGVDRVFVPKLAASLAVPETEATFEQLPYILEAGVKLETPAADGSGSGYIYEYDMPTSTTKTIRTYTIETGDGIDVDEMEYAFVESFTLSGNAGEALKMASSWRGRQSVDSSFTVIGTLPAVEEIPFSKGKLYIDASGGTIGTTQKSNTLLAMSLDVTTGWTPVFTGDGALYFSFAKCTMPEVTLDITFEHDSSAAAEKVAWRAKTGRLVRLLWQGTALTTAGTTYTYKTLQVDLAGKWETFGTLGEQDGNNVSTGTLRARYNTTDTLFCEFTVVNELSALP